MQVSKQPFKGASKQISMSMRLPEDLSNELVALAEATGRTKSFLAIEAIRDFVEREKWQIAKIQKGIKEADEGLFASDEDLKALDAKWSYNAD